MKYAITTANITKTYFMNPLFVRSTDIIVMNTYYGDNPDLKYSFRPPGCLGFSIQLLLMS
jgi:hypothetical protein